MKISNITAAGLKGPRFSHDIEALTIICGGNFRGKSRIVDAARLALLGYLPELGKTPAATFKLAEGAELMAEITFDTGVAIRRSWVNTGKTIKTEAGVVPEDIAAFVPFMANIKEYFSLPPQGRMDYLFKAVANGPVELKSLRAKFKNIKLAAGSNNETSEAVLEKCLGVLDDLDAEQPARIFYTDAIDVFKTKLSEANAYLKRMVGTVQGLTELKAMEAQLAGIQPAEIAAQLTAATAAARTKNAALATLNQRVNAAGQQAEKNKAVQRWLEEHKAHNPADEKNHTDLMTDTEAKAETARQDLLKAQRARDEVAVAWRGEKTEVAKAQATVDGLTVELSEIDELECCPTCKAKAKGWKAVVEQDIKTRLAAASAELVKRQEALTKLTEQGADKAAVLSKAEEAAKLTRETASNARDTLDKFQDINRTYKSYKDFVPTESIVPTPEEIAAAKTEDEAAQRNVATLNERQREADRLAQDVKRVAQAQQEKVRTELEVECYKQAVELLQADKDTLVTEAVGTVLEPANRIMRSVIPELVYENGLFGYRKGTTFVDSATFSGTEEALAYMGIALGLASKSPFKLGIVDELGRLDALNQKLFLSAVSKAISDGVLDQFIGIIPVSAKDVKKIMPGGDAPEVVIEIK